MPTVAAMHRGSNTRCRSSRIRISLTTFSLSVTLYDLLRTKQLELALHAGQRRRAWSVGCCESQKSTLWYSHTSSSNASSTSREWISRTSTWTLSHPGAARSWTIWLHATEENASIRSERFKPSSPDSLSTTSPAFTESQSTKWSKSRTFFWNAVRATYVRVRPY